MVQQPQQHEQQQEQQQQVSGGCPRWFPPTCKYLFIKDLGSGTFGKVVLARNVGTNELVAIKQMDRASLVLRYIERELINHSQLRHPHVVQFRELFLTDQHVNVVMDFANSGTLFDLVQQRTRLREIQARWFFQQLIMAVDYCHRKGVANRDIKLENTLLTMVPDLPRPLVKICDFGYSKHDEHSAARSEVGTPHYIAPEVLQPGTYDGKAADIWSCGVVLYTMLVGRFPFQSTGTSGASLGEQLRKLLRRMRGQAYALPEHLGLSEPCKDLLRAMLQPEPAQRASMAGIMAHPWFLTHLPPGAATMNEGYLAKPRPCAQSETDIRQIAREAVLCRRLRRRRHMDSLPC